MLERVADVGEEILAYTPPASARAEEEQSKIRWDWPPPAMPPYNWHAEHVWPRDGYFKEE